MSENMRIAEEKREAREAMRMSGHTIALEQRKPRDFLRTASPPPFEYSEAPPVIAQFAQAFSESTGFDRSGIIVAATVAAAAMIDDRLRIVVRPESNWEQSARLWAVLLGTPSAGKSPTITAATDIIKVLHQANHALWLQSIKGVDPKEHAREPALFTSNATIAKLAERLRDNPRGMLMLTEEFSSWIGGIDAADRGAAAGNRGDWLQLYDGGAHQIDRVVKGSFTVPNWGASVIAACTPDGLREHMKQMPEDGLIHRFIPVVMNSPDLDARGDVRAARAQWDAVLRWVYDNTACQQGLQFVNLSREAAKLFEDEHRTLRALTDSTYEFAPAFASHLGKQGGMLARVALAFHVLTGVLSNEVNDETMATAIRFMRRVRQHAASMFNDILGTSPAMELARALARSLAADEDKPPSIGRDWMRRQCRAFVKAEERVQREAVDVLCSADWLQPKLGKTYGGWPAAYEVHHSIYLTFAADGEKWRARRDAVRQAIGQMGE